MDTVYKTNTVVHTGDCNPENLCNHLFGHLEGHLVAFVGKQARLSNPNAPRNMLTGIKQKSFLYPEQVKLASDYLTNHARAGFDAYFGVHLFQQAHTRLAEHAVKFVQTLWLDEDEGTYPDIGPKPTVIIHSSAKRRQLHWALSKPIPARHAVLLNKRIAAWAGGDTGKAGLASVLRPPETFNYKRYPAVDVVSGSITGVSPWDPEVVDQAIPPLPKKSKKTQRPYNGPAGAGINLSHWLDDQGIEILGDAPDDKGCKFAIVCPWSDEHSSDDTSGTYVGQYPAEDGSPTGPMWFHCNHAHCEGRVWRNFREKLEPGCYIPWWVKVVAKNG
jgi:hypothetical protein